MADNYNASTARDAYYPDSSSQIARLHAREKKLHDYADFGLVEFFEGAGDNPTGLTGYSTDKLWLRTTAGVTTTAGTIRFYNGGDATQLANWPTLTKQGLAIHMGVRGADLDFVWSSSTSGDPGSGKISVNHATLSSATTISISKTGRVGQSYGTTLSGIIANGARFLVYQLGSQTLYANVTTTGAGTDNSTYVTFPISVTTATTLTAGSLLGVAYQSSQLPANSLNNLIAYDTKAAADAALSGLSNGQVIKILADETRGGGRAIYKKTSGAYVYQRLTSMRAARAELGLPPIAGFRRTLAKYKTAHQGTVSILRGVMHGDSTAADVWAYLGTALNASIGGPSTTYPVNDGAGDVAISLIGNIGFLCTATGSVTNLTTATDVWPSGAVMRCAVGTTTFQHGGADPTWSEIKVYWVKKSGAGAFDMKIGGSTVASYNADNGGSAAIGVHTATQTHATTAVAIEVTSGVVDVVVVTGCDTRKSGLWLVGSAVAGQTLAQQMQYAAAQTVYGQFLADFQPDIFTFGMKEIDNPTFVTDLGTLGSWLDSAIPLADKLFCTTNPYTNEGDPTQETAHYAQMGQLIDWTLAKDDSYHVFDLHAAYGANGRVDSYGLMAEPDDVHATSTGQMHASTILLDGLAIGRNPWHYAITPVNAQWRPSYLGSGSTLGQRGQYFGTVEKIYNLGTADDSFALDWSATVGRRYRLKDQTGTVLLQVSNLGTSANYVTAFPANNYVAWNGESNRQRFRPITLNSVNNGIEFWDNTAAARAPIAPGVVYLQTLTVATAPAAGSANGMLVYLSDGAGGAGIYGSAAGAWVKLT